jgi:hypothetical protein
MDLKTFLNMNIDRFHWARKIPDSEIFNLHQELTCFIRYDYYLNHIEQLSIKKKPRIALGESNGKFCNYIQEIVKLLYQKYSCF